MKFIQYLASAAMFLWNEQPTNIALMTGTIGNAEPHDMMALRE